MSPPRAVSVITHARADVTAEALHALSAAAVEADVTLRLGVEEREKHAETIGALAALEPGAATGGEIELCVALGGDGTILRALRCHARTRAPVFAVNFGEVGFLATVEPAELRSGFERALAGELEMLSLPAIELDTPAGTQTAINDVSVHRRPGERVAELSYSLGGEEVGSVRCDGLVVATPAGSTGYNLANGGPVMAWGVEGMVVSFIAPHTLTARALVIAPGDVLTLKNRSRRAVDLSVDGRPIEPIGPGEEIDARFVDDVAKLVQVNGSSFYRRLREKFGRLSR
ncbi:MAG: NAD(+)/NADH kinase [Solirubrobacteraceae bacterium]